MWNLNDLIAVPGVALGQSEVLNLAALHQSSDWLSWVIGWCSGSVSRTSADQMRWWYKGQNIGTYKADKSRNERKHQIWNGTHCRWPESFHLHSGKPQFNSRVRANWQRVLLALAEKGVPYEIQSVDWQAAEHKSPAYLKNQPFGVVPYLIDDGFIVYGINSIS